MLQEAQSTGPVWQTRTIGSSAISQEAIKLASRLVVQFILIKTLCVLIFYYTIAVTVATHYDTTGQSPSLVLFGELMIMCNT